MSAVATAFRMAAARTRREQSEPWRSSGNLLPHQVLRELFLLLPRLPDP
jgi:hypothetical protein